MVLLFLSYYVLLFAMILGLTCVKCTASAACINLLLFYVLEIHLHNELSSKLHYFIMDLLKILKFGLFVVLLKIFN